MIIDAKALVILQETDINVEYSIKSIVKSVRLEIIGADSYNGTVSYELKGQVYTTTKGMDLATFNTVTSVSSPDSSGVKIDIDVEGWNTLKVKLVGRTTGSVSIYLRALD